MFDRDSNVEQCRERSMSGMTCLNEGAFFSAWIALKPNEQNANETSAFLAIDFSFSNRPTCFADQRPSCKPSRTSLHCSRHSKATYSQAHREFLTIQRLNTVFTFNSLWTCREYRCSNTSIGIRENGLPYGRQLRLP